MDGGGDNAARTGQVAADGSSYWTGLGTAGWDRAVRPAAGHELVAVSVSGNGCPDSAGVRELLKTFAPEGGETCRVVTLTKGAKSHPWDHSDDEHAGIVNNGCWSAPESRDRARTNHGLGLHLDPRCVDALTAKHGVSVTLPTSADGSDPPERDNPFGWVHGKLLIARFRRSAMDGSPSKKARTEHPRESPGGASGREECLRVSVFTHGPADLASLSKLQYAVWASPDFDMVQKGTEGPPSEFGAVLRDYMGELVRGADRFAAQPGRDLPTPSEDVFVTEALDSLLRADCRAADRQGYRLVTAVVGAWSETTAGQWPLSDSPDLFTERLYGQRRLKSLFARVNPVVNPLETVVTKTTLAVAVHSIANGATENFLQDFRQSWGADRVAIVWPCTDAVWGRLNGAAKIENFLPASDNYCFRSYYATDAFTAGEAKTQKDQKHAVRTLRWVPRRTTVPPLPLDD